MEQPTQRNNHVLPRNTLRQHTLQLHTSHRRDLPPRSPRSPNTCRIRPDHRCTQTRDSTIHIGVRVTGDCKGSRPRIALLDHNLMSNSSSGGVEHNPLLLREVFNVFVFPQIRLRLVLHVVVKGEYNLLSVIDLCRTDRKELCCHRP